MLINRLLAELDERHIAQVVTIPIDEKRNNYPLRSNTVNDFHEFDFVITDFYNYLFNSFFNCIYFYFLYRWCDQYVQAIMVFNIEL